LDVIVYIDLAPVTATIERVPVVTAGTAGRMVITPRRSPSPFRRRPR
jgi:hypothetical protein